MNERARFGEGMVTIVGQWTARKCKIRWRFGKKQPLSSQSVKKLLPWLVAVALFMESLDTTILNTAVPVVSDALHVSPLAMKSVLASYTLSLAVFIPISGWMADRFGTGRVFAGAIGLFTLGSFLCGISSDIRLLVACRLLQGCGGAMMVPVGRLTLVRTFVKCELIRRELRGHTCAAGNLWRTHLSNAEILGLLGPLIQKRQKEGRATNTDSSEKATAYRGAEGSNSEQAHLQKRKFRVNRMAYADLTEPETSNGSSIASTMQQLSMSFGVATASLATALFVPEAPPPRRK